MQPLPLREVLRRLAAAGYVEVGRRGSHIKLARKVIKGTRTVIVPAHREVAAGTLRSILRQTGISPAEFDRL